jgi:hypothetical protein
MRDLTKRPTLAVPPKGLAFEIADLLLAREWAERHNLRMLIRLDHGAAVGEEYEEVITFQTQACRSTGSPYGVMQRRYLFSPWSAEASNIDRSPWHLLRAGAQVALLYIRSWAYSSDWTA